MNEKRTNCNVNMKPVFVVGTEMDVRSLAEIDEEAIALGRIENVDRLLTEIRKKGSSASYVLCSNHENSLRTAFLKIKSELGKSNISCVYEDIAGEHKSLHAALLADKEALKSTVNKAKSKLDFSMDAVGNYIMREMDNEIREFKQNSNLKTGFENLDKLAGAIYPGLYVIGAISSLGKTTFAHQMADKMAAEKQHVLFFSYEQNRLDLVCKSIARMTAQKDLNTAITSLEARMMGDTKPVLDVRNEYVKTIGNYLNIILGENGYTVSQIKDYVKKYIERTGIKPVVIVDYLQFIPADPLYKGAKKDLIDEEVSALKWLSRAENIPVILISSVNRSNYLTTIDYESFKESGGIEYTADVLWGLQLAVLNDSNFDSVKDTKKKRDEIREAKNADPRKIELVCLKNRYGISSYCAKFDYYASHDLFVPAEEDQKDSIKKIESADKKKVKRF